MVLGVPCVQVPQRPLAEQVGQADHWLRKLRVDPSSTIIIGIIIITTIFRCYSISLSQEVQCFQALQSRPEGLAVQHLREGLEAPQVHCALGLPAAHRDIDHCRVFSSEGKGGESSPFDCCLPTLQILSNNSVLYFLKDNTPPRPLYTTGSHANIRPPFKISLENTLH